MHNSCRLWQAAPHRPDFEPLDVFCLSYAPGGRPAGAAHERLGAHDTAFWAAEGTVA
jgi:hypothetical protein